MGRLLLFTQQHPSTRPPPLQHPRGRPLLGEGDQPPLAPSPTLAGPAVFPSCLLAGPTRLVALLRKRKSFHKQAPGPGRRPGGISGQSGLLPGAARAPGALRGRATLSAARGRGPRGRGPRRRRWGEPGNGLGSVGKVQPRPEAKGVPGRPPRRGRLGYRPTRLPRASLGRRGGSQVSRPRRSPLPWTGKD